MCSYEDAQKGVSAAPARFELSQHHIHLAALYLGVRMFEESPCYPYVLSGLY